MENFERVLREARAGRREAWEQLYASSGPAVLGYLRARDVPDAEDQVCESFLDAVRGLSRFEGDGRAFHLWLLAIAHRRAEAAGRRGWLGWFRRAGQSRDGEVRQGAEVEHFAAMQRVREIVGALPGDQQAVVLLDILGELSLEELGEVVEKRPATVGSLLRKGQGTLGKKLAAGRASEETEDDLDAFASAARKLFLEGTDQKTTTAHVAAITEMAVAVRKSGQRRT